MPNLTITTLGTSHGDPTPTRFNSSTLIEIDQSLYLIDAGVPVDALIKQAGKNLLNLKAAFITHMHNDHVGGLPTVYKAFVKHAKNKENLTIFLPEAHAKQPMLDWLKVQYVPIRHDLITFKTTQPGPIFNNDHIDVQALSTVHDGASVSYSYLVTAHGKRLLFSGDLTKQFTDSNFPQIAQNTPCDVCICECTHFDVEVAMKILAKCPIKKIIFNHVADRFHGPGEKELLALAKHYLPFPYALAHDGDRFVISQDKLTPRNISITATP